MYLHAWGSKWARNAIKWLLRWDERELLWHKRGFSPIHIPFHPTIYDRHNVLHNGVLWKPSSVALLLIGRGKWNHHYSSLEILYNTVVHPFDQEPSPARGRAPSRPCPLTSERIILAESNPAWEVEEWTFSIQHMKASFIWPKVRSLYSNITTQDLRKVLRVCTHGLAVLCS